jgi:flagellar protein FlgJ
MQITSLPKPAVPADIAPERLAHNATLTEQQKISEASRQFEAILLRQILAASQKTVIQSKLADNSTSAEIYRDMITEQLANSISKSGAFGLAQTFEQQLTPPAGSGPSAATALNHGHLQHAHGLGPITKSSRRVITGTISDHTHE